MNESHTRQLLQAAHTHKEEEHLKLYHELARVNRCQQRDSCVFTALSVKLSPGAFNRNRYDSAVYTSAKDAPLLYGSVLRSAPTAAITQLLRKRPNYVAKWIGKSKQTFSYLAVDFGVRRFKIYLFETAASTFLEGKNLWHLLPRLHDAAYIDCLEIDLDEPARHFNPVYFKLRAANLRDVLASGYRPHPQIDNRQLTAVPDAKPIVAAIARMTAGLRRANDPVIKMRYTLGGGDLVEEMERFRQTDYTISINTFDPSYLKSINGHRAAILDIADALDCHPATLDWLDAITPFNCYISYLAVGSDAVTIYYKTRQSTLLSWLLGPVIGRQC